ncbi:LysE family translocator [Microbacterium aurum]
MTALGLVAFVLAALVAVATPGPTVLLAMSNGARHSVKGALPGILGALLSDLILITAVGAGLGAVLMASVVAFEIVRWVGVAYLCVLAIRLIHSSLRSRALRSPAPAGGSAHRQFAVSLGVALTNPKGYLFFAALLPQFVDPDAVALPQYALLALIFITVDAAVMLGYASAGAVLRTRVPSRGGRIVGVVSGGALLAVAVGLAMHRAPSAV